jgi:membrane-bound serine protease (ClpP class)
MRHLCRLGGLLLLLLLAFPAFPASAQDPDRRVNVVRIVGAVDRSYASYLAGEIRGSERRGDAAVLLQLKGTGSIEIDEEELLAVVRESTVTVAAWVGPVPLGRTAAVGGTHTALWLAADMRFVAHGARVRSMVPMERGGTAGPVASPADVPAELLTPGGELTEKQVLDAGLATRVPRTGDGEGKIVDGTVNSLPDAVRAVIGSEAAQTAIVRYANPRLVTKVRQAVGTNPTLVYLLLLCGAGAVVFELFQPGFGPAGYAGAMLVALAAYGLWALPADPLGLALTGAALVALTVDVARGGLGPLTWGGTAALAVGARRHVDTGRPPPRVPWPWVAAGTFGAWVFWVVVMTVVLRALRGNTAQLGAALVGRVGEVRSTLNPQGHVLVEGALWRARALEWDGPVGAGTRVTVTGVDEEALILDVEPVPERG